MNYLGRFINNFRCAYKEINSATLTGAIDIVVVEQPDGSFTCSPFHVRFGKLGVLRSREKIVEIEINGEPLNIYMKLGDSGEAFFVEEVDEDISIPEHLVCSPIPDSEESVDQEFTFEENKDTNDNKNDEGSGETNEETYFDKNLESAVLPPSQIVPAVNGLPITERISTDSSDITEDEGDSSVDKTDAVDERLDSEQHNVVNCNAFDHTAVVHDHSHHVASRKVSCNEDELKIPNVDFKPIISVSDNDECCADIVKKDTINISKSARKSVPTIAKRKRKKRVNSKKKVQNKTHDNGVLINGNEIKHGSTNDLHTTPLVQVDGDTHRDLTGDLEVDENNINDSLVPMTSVSDLHFFSDTEVTTSVSSYDRFFAPVQSDTEFEISNRQAEGTERALSENSSASMSALSHTSWKWGELPSTVPKSDAYDAPDIMTEVETKRSTIASMLGFMKRTKHIRQKSTELKDGGIYLSQLIANELDPDVASLYIPHSSGSESNTAVNIDNSPHKQKNNHVEDDSESGNGPSLPQSPSSELEGQMETNCKLFDGNLDVAISLWGSLYPSDSVPSVDLFDKHKITYEQFLNDPSVFKNPNLVFRVNGKIYKWETACPLILSMALFGRSLPEDVINRLEQDRVNRASNASKIDEENKNRYRRGYYSWFNWARSRQQKSTDKDDVGISSLDGVVKQVEKPPLLPSKSSPALVNSASFNDNTEITNIIGEGMELNTPSTSGYDAERYKLITYSSSESEYEPESELVNENLPDKYRKTLRLSSQQIANLNLRDGSNEVVFSVTTAYQGTTRCWCNLFKWRHDDKIVVSDIDGTITKSDVLGHIMPIVGNDWAQSGVAKLFNKIKDNGYQLLYLSSRAIGQSRGTRKYLCSIKQEDLTLPEGPLLLNPTSLLSAFHREVIEKKPEKFKISCLRDIQALFPPDSNPFYAGYGNRINDVWAYQAVGIPIFRIFTINHRGELKHELTQTFQSSYTNMSQIADQMFPVQSRRDTAEDFSQFIYWRDPLPNIDEEQLLQELKTA